MTDATAQPLTFQKGSQHAYSQRFGSATENDVYNAIFPNIANFDVSASVLQLSNGSTIENAAAVAGYFSNDNAGSPSNPVALFGCGAVKADHGVGWGMNTLLQDSAVRQAGSGVGRMLIGAELDFNVMNPATNVIGVSVGGNSLAQPADANAFVVNTLSQTYGYKWTTGFNSMDGAATHALNVGMAAKSGAEVNSQTVLFHYSNSLRKQSISLRVESGGWMVFNGSVPPKGYAFRGADVFMDAKQCLRIDGDSIVSGRRHGWGLPSGTTTRQGFDTDNTTLAQLAQRVGALINDLHIHGLIGA